MCDPCSDSARFVFPSTPRAQRRFRVMPVGCFPMSVSVTVPNSASVAAAPRDSSRSRSPMNPASPGADRRAGAFEGERSPASWGPSSGPRRVIGETPSVRSVTLLWRMVKLPSYVARGSSSMMTFGPAPSSIGCKGTPAGTETIRGGGYAMSPSASRTGTNAAGFWSASSRVMLAAATSAGVMGAS
jgi:hypothetical protein